MRMLTKLFPRKPRAARLPLHLTNTRSRTKEVFEPMKRDGIVRMYNCGPTVYDLQHIGNLRPQIFASVLRRTLAYNGYRVRQVNNITDVGHLTSDADEGEDKMTVGLQREGKAITLRNMKALGTKYTKTYLKDLEQLNIDTDKISFPRASAHIDEQIALAKTLEEKGYAYTTSDGLYFDTRQFPRYAELGNINVEKLKEGARVEANTEKHSPADFALWKLDRNLGWDSPWGKGFPGWHLECTAMIFAELGKQIDIHTGGIDLIPTHHNNEIAQAEAATGRSPHVKYWLHSAHISVEGQKISKSIGNTIYLRNLVDRGFNPLAYRYWLLTAHYRTPVNFTWEALEAAQTALTRLHRFFIEELGNANGTVNEQYRAHFHSAVNDDLDTPKALSILWELVHDESVACDDKRATLIDFDKVLGIGLLEGSKRLKEMLRNSDKRLSVSEAPKRVQQLLKARKEARATKDWEQADALRDEIASLGFQVVDTEDGAELHEL